MLTVDMKALLFALIILACAFPLQADNLLQNGDFSDGKTHWHGDGKTPDEYAQDNQDNPPATSDPLMSKGLIIQLKPDRWTKIAQDFKGDNSTHYVFTLTYKVSPDLTLSNKADDYANIADHIRFEGYESWPPVSIAIGQFFETVGDLDDYKGFYEKFPPKLGSSDTQTYVDPGPPISPLGNKMVTVAFPPGTGTVVILNVSVTTN
jgi:hypothetical protein